jgi:hypothetical protein
MFLCVEPGRGFLLRVCEAVHKQQHMQSCTADAGIARRQAAAAALLHSNPFACGSSVCVRKRSTMPHSVILQTCSFVTCLNSVQ